MNTTSSGSAVAANISKYCGGGKEPAPAPAPAPAPEPSEAGFTFAGWYQDSACSKAWNFETDILQTDLTLYAKWLVNSNNSGGFSVQEIADVYYTGKQCKPSVSSCSDWRRG